MPQESIGFIDLWVPTKGAADGYGQSVHDYIPAGASALKSANSELESSDSSSDSNPDTMRIGV